MTKFYNGSLIFSILFFVLGQFDASAQTSFTLKEADRFYENYHYASAIPLYESWLTKQPHDTVVIERLADSYSKINDAVNEERLYKKLIEEKPSHKNGLLKYASVLAENGKYEQSMQYFKLYSENGGDTRGIRYVEAFRNLDKFYKDSSAIVIKPLIVNSRHDDFSPAFYKSGILFCSDRVSGQVRKTFDWNQSAYLDIYYLMDTTDVFNVSEKSEEEHKQKKGVVTAVTHSDQTYQTSNDTRTLGYLNRPVHNDSLYLDGSRVVKFSNAINTKYHEGPLVFFNGEDSLIFTRNNYYRGKYKTDEEGVNKLKLFIARKEGQAWSVKSFPYNSDQYSVGHPALSPDNKVLFFASDMPGGKGGTDIWYCNWTPNGWSKPQNLSEVNTEGQEMFPFVDQKGNLYLASDGWGGLGGLDVFCSRNLQQGFDTPRNVGSPINSSKDDFGLIVKDDGRTGYFSSGRNWKETLDDIYYFKSKTELVKPYFLKGIAKEDSTNVVLPQTTIVLLNEKEEQIAVVETGADGSFSFPVEPSQMYHLKASKNDYVPYTKSISTEGIKPDEPAWVDAILSKKDLSPDSSVIAKNTNDKNPDMDDPKTGQRIDKGKSLNVNPIYFDLNKWNIRPDAAKELDKIVAVMTENPGLKIELGSHTDSRGTDSYNLSLSDKRAKASATYIISKGISSDRIVGKGYGELRLVNGCANNVKCSEAHHQQNRRTEFIVIGISN
jgi:outer membrane protein OmpA-like peptidoglycan-associated protein